MAEINWDKLVIEGRAIARGIPLPEGITHISQMEETSTDNDAISNQSSELTKKELKAILLEKGIEFTDKMTRDELLVLVPSETSTGETAPTATTTEDIITGDVGQKEPTDNNDSDTL